MKMPKRPPDTEKLFREVVGDTDKLLDSIEGAKETERDAGYPHWDRLLHLKPPRNLTHEEWWLGIKLARKSAMKELPLLKDKGGRPFYYSLPDPVPQLLHEIDLRAGGRISMPAQVTNPETRNQYVVESLIEEAITSSQLEGATTTRKIAENMIRTGRKPQDRSERMILNNYRTMRHISSIKSEAMTKELVLDIHSAVTQGTLDTREEEGRFRRVGEDIVVSDSENNVFHHPPIADEVERRVDQMCRFANGEPKDVFIHPVLRSLILHFWLAYDHPFVDGNGRTARALFYWSMLHQEYWLCEYISISQILLKAPAKYGRSFLHTETDDNDLTYFILYQIDVFCKSIDELHAFIHRRMARLREMESRVKNVDLLNHRQRAMLSHALRHPGHDYTIASHTESHGVSYETGRSDLLNLAKRQLLNSRKRGKKWVFTAPDDLDRRLSAPE